MVGLWVRIVILVALAFAELDFPENSCHCFQASTWHTARDGSDYDGTAHTSYFGICVHIRADWSWAAMISQIAWLRLVRSLLR